MDCVTQLCWEEEGAESCVCGMCQEGRLLSVPGGVQDREREEGSGGPVVEGVPGCFEHGGDGLGADTSDPTWTSVEFLSVLL